LRKALSLAQVIWIIILISFLLIVTLKQASIVAKHTGDSYAYQRAELFSRSAVEIAMLAIHAHDRNATGECLKEIKISDEQFDANVTVKKYYLHKNEPYKCTDTNLYTDIETEDSNGMVWLEVTVTPKEKFTDTIHLVRTTLQKL